MSVKAGDETAGHVSVDCQRFAITSEVLLTEKSSLSKVPPFFKFWTGDIHVNSPLVVKDCY